MKAHPAKRSDTGVALIIILMVLTALLALGVVYLSRLARQQPQPAPADTSAPDATPPPDEATPSPAPVETPAADPVMLPPPPPSIATPDTGHLPPEG